MSELDVTIVGQTRTKMERNKEYSDSFNDIQLLSEIGKDIISNLSVENIVKTVFNNINVLMDASFFAIGIFNNQSKELDFWGISAMNAIVKSGHEPMEDNSRWSVQCFKQQKEIIIKHRDHSSRANTSGILFGNIHRQRKSLIYLPLVNMNKKIGIISVQSYSPNAYTEYQLNLLRNLAIYTTIALENASAYHTITKQNEEILEKTRRLEKAHQELELIVEKRTRKIQKQKEKLQEQAKNLETINNRLEFLSIVAEQTDNAIMIMDAYGYILWINKSFTRIYEFTYNEFTNRLGKNIKETSFNQDIEKTLNQCIETKKAVVYEALNITSSGKEIWTQTSLTPILNEHGKIVNLVTIDSDISKLKEAEKEILRKNKEIEKLSIVAEQTDNAIMIMDACGNIQWINKSFTRIYEFTYNEFTKRLGKNIKQTSFNPDIEKTINKCIETKKAGVYEALNITSTGNKIWTQTSLTPILNEQGEIVNLVTIDSDISKRKEAEEKIVKQNQDITDSILYASRIQSALLTVDPLLLERLPEHFIMFRPKQIVSGDFYWIKEFKSAGPDEEQSGLFAIAAADCTGHGVPGAFMSLLSISFLNEIINRKKLTRPDAILNELRRKIKISLQQTGKSDESKDGLDIALCVLDVNTGELQYAGANNPLYIIRHKNLPAIQCLKSVEYADYVLYHIKPDKQPIGIYPREKKFRINETGLFPGDTVYLFSDGYIDQFGEKTKRKFTSRRFKEYLLTINTLPLEIQKQRLSETIETWIGECEQLDDILVMAFRY